MLLAIFRDLVSKNRLFLFVTITSQQFLKPLQKSRGQAQKDGRSFHKISFHQTLPNTRVSIPYQLTAHALLNY